MRVLAAGLNRLDHHAGLSAGCRRSRVPADHRGTSYVIRGIAERGTYAQCMVVPERWVVRDGTRLSPAEAATLLIPVVTGVRAVKIVGEVKEGDLVLVHAGASGTGSINVQIARALGTRAAATIRTPEKAGFVRDLGAELVVPTNEDDFVSAVRDWSEGRGVSAVIDNLGGEVLTRSLDCLTPFGRLMSMGFVAGMGATIQIRPFFFAQRQIRGTLMGDVEDLEWGLEQVRRGRIRPRPWITPSRSPKRPRRTRTSRRRRAAAPCSCSGKKPDLLNVSNGSEHRLLRDLGADGV